MPDFLQITGDNFIGSTHSRQGSRTFSVRDRNECAELSGRFSLATMEEIDAAGDLAHRAFVEWKSASPSQRARFLRAIADNIEALGDELLQRASAETALPIPRLTGERARTTGQIRMFADLIEEGSWVQASIDHALPDRQPIPKPDVRRMQIPLGPIVVFGASNFPFAYSVAGGDTASALAAGCPVIVKAHPAHPGTSELVAKAILKAASETSAPEGVFSMLHCDNDSALELVRHWRIKAVGFTGSVGGGLALQRAGFERDEPIPVFAEMGSVNPLFLLPGALEAKAESIADGYVASVTLGVGQFCTNPGVVFGVASDGWNRFVATCREKIGSVTAGTMLTDSIGESYLTEVRHRLNSKGVELLAGGAEVGAPTLLAVAKSNASPHSGILDEIFGPCGVLITCASESEMLEAASELEGQLTASIHHADSDETAELTSILREKAGRIVFNGFPTGVEVCPSMVHGGPFPATTDSRFTAVGTSAIARWTRPVCFQNCPDNLLPDELKEANPMRIWRTVNGALVAP